MTLSYKAIINLSLPGDRTVFVEGVQPTYPDGIPDQALLDDVRDSINTDPVTGESRPPLGETNETLFVNPITRTGFYVEVSGLAVGDGGATILQQAKDEIEEALLEYFSISVKPFVDSTDSEIDRRDTITLVSISKVIQDVLNSLGGSSEGVDFGTSISYGLTTYTLGQGELSKLVAVAFV